jgi:hypothetical protein
VILCFSSSEGSVLDGRIRFSAVLIVLLIAFGLCFPFLGGSMILVGLTERLILRRIPVAQGWLGLCESGRVTGSQFMRTGVTTHREIPTTLLAKGSPFRTALM